MQKIKTTVVSIIFLLGGFVLAAQNATVSVPDADVYKDENFDSEIIENVKLGETYQISNKIYGQFYKIKLKSGKIGYIADHELKVNGKEFEDRPFKESFEEPKPSKKTITKNNQAPTNESQEDEEDSFVTQFKGVTLQLINFHEETIGSLQVDNLYTVGFKSMDFSTIWEIFGSFKTPKYYAEKTNGSAEGFHIWVARGFNSLVPATAMTYFRYGGSILLHLARTKVTTPSKTYDLQDLTAGVLAEGGYVVKFKKVALEVTAKYIFDRNNYGGLGLSLLF